MGVDMAIKLNDIGTTFTLTITDDDGVAVDITGATTKSIIFLKPDGVSETKTAAFGSDGSDGIISYTTVAGDLDTAGLWHVQAYVDISNGDVIFHSAIDAFEVGCNLDGL